MDIKTYQSILAALVTATTVGLLALLVAPIAKPLAWALIIGLATLPHHRRLVAKYPDNLDRCAGLMVLATTFCLIMPVTVLILMVVQNAAEWYTKVERLAHSFNTAGAETLSHLPFASEINIQAENFGIDLPYLGAKLSAGASEYLFDLVTNAAIYVGDTLFTLAVMQFILYFIYRDGEKIIFATINRFATDPDRANHYFSEICAITSAVAVGTILTCLVQGLIAGLGYYVAGTPAPFLFALLTTVAALVPVVGTGLIWIPLTAFFVLNGAYLKAALLAAWCLIFVGLADNAIRPLAIGAKSNIPTAAVVLGAICGVSTMGILGLILGPIIFAIFITVWRDIADTKGLKS